MEDVLHFMLDCSIKLKLASLVDGSGSIICTGMYIPVSDILTTLAQQPRRLELHPFYTLPITYISLLLDKDFLLSPVIYPQVSFKLPMHTYLT
jgi:hypothetical protein